MSNYNANSGEIRVVIGEDDEEIRNYYCIKINEQSNMKVVGAAENGQELLEYINKCKPDVVVMDIVLRELDGFGVLGEMKKRGYPKNVVVLSCLCNNQAVSEVNRFGIKYFLPKPVYSERLVEIIKNIHSEKHSETLTYEYAKSDEETINICTSETLRLMGVYAHLNGYRFLKKAIEFNIQNTGMAEALTKELYPAVAKMYERENWTSVERSIRTALDEAWDSGDAGEWFKLFGCSKLTRKNRPKNKQIIITLSEEINSRIARQKIL